MEALEGLLSSYFITSNFNISDFKSKKLEVESKKSEVRSKNLEVGREVGS